MKIFLAGTYSRIYVMDLYLAGIQGQAKSFVIEDYQKQQKTPRPYILESFYYADEDTERLIPQMGDVLLDSSMIMYFIANMADVYLFTRLKEKSDGKRLWLRNNVSTILCNCLENFGFIALAFAGIYDGKTILIIAASTSVVEFIVALLDTPFLYLAKRFK